MRNPGIIVLGSVNTDLVVKVAELPRPGATVIGGVFYQNQGGKGANQAVAAARLAQCPVSLLAAVGNDNFGRESLSHLSQEKLELSHLITKTSVSSGIALIMVDSKGENLIAVASGANALLSPADIEGIPSDVFGRATVFLSCLEIPVETVITGLKKAKALGLTTILNPAPAAGNILTMLRGLVDILTPNESEAAQLTGISVTDETSADQAAAIIRTEAKIPSVIFTLGAEGCILANDSGVRHFPAFVVEAVDTTAAGDAFNGALAVGLAEGLAMSEAIRRAMAAAAISVTRLGAQPSLPAREDVESFLLAADH